MVDVNLITKVQENNIRLHKKNITLEAKIKELEAENERLKEGLSNAYPITDQEMGRV